MECPICKNSENVKLRCEYKYEIKEDTKYFGELNVCKCEKCDFSFAIKFILNYNDTDSKRSVLKQYFN